MSTKDIKRGMSLSLWRNIDDSNRYTKYGSPDVLELKEVEKPALKEFGPGALDWGKLSPKLTKRDDLLAFLT